MAEASDTLINSLNARIDTLTRELATANAESKNRKIALRKLTEQVTALTTERDASSKERDTLKEAATAQPSELQTKIDDLTLKLRTITHQKRFDAMAKEAGCDETALAAAWKLAGYTPEADEADEAKLTEALERVKSDLPLAFKPAQTGQGAPAGAKKPLLQTGVGGDRGSPGKLPSTMKVTKANLRDITWTKANQKAMSEAISAGTIEYVD